MKSRPSTRFKKSQLTQWFIPIVFAVLVLILAITLVVAIFLFP